MINQMAQVDLRDDKLVVISSSRTTAGFWIDDERFEILPNDVDDDVLGNTIRDALSRSRHGVAVPPREKNPSAPILKAFGVRSYRKYMEGTRKVQIYDDDAQEGLEIVPAENAGRDGFLGMESATEIVTRDTAAPELARAVRRAFERAQ